MGNASSEDIKDYLAGISSLALTYGTDLFIHTMPPEPAECVSIHDTGGFDPEAAVDYQRPSVQVRVRGNRGDYTSTHGRALDIRDELHALHGETLNSTRYIQVLQAGDIIDVGDDDNGRPIVTVNFNIHRTTS